MRDPLIGWCGPLGRADEFKAAGLDYIEAQIVPMRLEDDAAYAHIKVQIKELPLPALAMSYLFPHDLRLVGDTVDTDRWEKYFDRVVEILTLAGSRIVVLGSGWTRNISEGSSLHATQDQFAQALEKMADALTGAECTLVIEPLNRKESNFINSVAEGVQMAKRVGRNEVRGLADFYHMDEEREPLDTLLAQGDWVRHVHLADEGRLHPGSGSGTGAYDYLEFFKHLKANGYQGLLSCECGVKGEPLAAMQSSIAFIKEQWRRA